MMGSAWKKISPYLSKKDDMQILMLDFYGAGKTTILHVTKFGQIETAMPTIGFNLETVSYKNTTLTAWDLGGRSPIRPLWRYYYKTASAFIFAIDSNDRYFSYDLKTKPILIFANKQDLPNALSLGVINEKLHLSKLDEMNTKWYLQSASAVNNEGFQWLTKTMRNKIDLTQPIIETINDSEIMKNDFLSFWNMSHLK